MNTARQWALPDRLVELIESGFWPNRENVNQQNLRGLVDADLVREFAAEEDQIFFDAPPFALISSLVANGEKFWNREEANPSGLSHEHSIVIGDFGIGSDAPIVLDYSSDPKNPEVKRLKWGSSFSENQWVTAAKDFETMCRILNLPTTKKEDGDAESVA